MESGASTSTSSRVRLPTILSRDSRGNKSFVRWDPDGDNIFYPLTTPPDVLYYGASTACIAAVGNFAYYIYAYSRDVFVYNTLTCEWKVVEDVLKSGREGMLLHPPSTSVSI